jgi:hypothetical protein
MIDYFSRGPTRVRSTIAVAAPSETLLLSAADPLLPDWTSDTSEIDHPASNAKVVFNHFVKRHAMPPNKRQGASKVTPPQVESLQGKK